MINYYEIELTNSKTNKKETICIKGVKVPTKKTIISFIQEDMNKMGYDIISNIILVSKDYVLNSFDKKDIKNKPIFGLKSRSSYIKNIEELNKTQLLEIGGTRIELLGSSSIITPIRTKKQLDNSCVYSSAKSDSIKKSLCWKEGELIISNSSNQKIKTLSKILLSFGGNTTQIPSIEEDIDNILEYGQFWFGKNAIMMKGTPSQCHKNSCDLWETKNNRTHSRICTGYALDKTGVWRQHSWVINFKPNSNQIIETTMKRIGYFGFIMDEDDCLEFVEANM